MTGLRSDNIIKIADADFAAPFPSRLEFNPPVHGTWNIVHIGMLVPQSHQIYVCSENCMRGVVMTAAEMGLQDRFSCVTLEEKDLYSGNLEEITLEGVTDVLHKLARRRAPEDMPKAVLIFPVCLHHFMGCDLKYVYGELEERFPSIRFVRCWMDPIMRASGPSPDQKLRRAMMDLTEPGEGGAPLSFLGDLLPLDQESEPARLIRAAESQKDGQVFDAGPKQGVRPARAYQIQDCHTLEEYMALGSAERVACRTSTALPALRAAARRLRKEPLYLPFLFGYEGIRSQIRELSEALHVSPAEAGIDPEAEEAACEEALRRARQTLGSVPIAIDNVAVEHPLGLCRLLAEHGFNVREVYLDAFNPEEREDYEWLTVHTPELLICGTIQVEGRVLHGEGRGSGRGQYLAIGPKAAWYNETPHFVNMVYDGGLWGYSGIRTLCARIEDAFLTEKDTRELVPRKGLGCACIL